MTRSLFVLALALTACAGAPEAPTYHRDVKPVVDAYCVHCHIEGGLAPFPLTRFEEVHAVRELVAHAVTTRAMPPWGAAPGVRALRHDASLSQAQIDTLSGWVESGAARGDPADEGPPLIVDLGGLDRVDLTLEMPEPFTPTRSPDEYRCFSLPWPLDAPAYITGFIGQPGNQRVVHHLLTFLIPPEQAELVDGFDEDHEGPGYPCFGGPEPSEAPRHDGEPLRTRILGQWGPGNQGITLPAGSGLSVQPGSRAVLQVHYNTLTGADRTDRSALALRIDEEVEREGVVVPWLDVRWYFQPETMAIPAGEPWVHHGYAGVLERYAPLLSTGIVPRDGLVLHSLLPHMHQLGREIRMSLRRESGEVIDLLRIPRYDFAWQREYLLAEPVDLDPGDAITLDCWWDNTREARIASGADPEPRTVYWGEGTTDEMCVATVYLTTR